MIVSCRSLSFASVLALALAAGSPALAQDGPKPTVPVPVPVPEASPEVVPSTEPVVTAPQAQDGSDPGGEDGEGPEAAEPEIVPIPVVWAPVPRDETGRTAYGLFLAGRYLTTRGSEIEGDAQAGARALIAARTLTPEQPVLTEQAFVSALLAGDLNGAVEAAPSAEATPATLSGVARLVQSVLDFDTGQAQRGSDRLKTEPVEPPHAAAALLVQPWIAAAARDWDFALLVPPAGSDTLFSVMRLQRAQLLERRRRFEEAETELKALVDQPGSQPAFRAAYGEFLERRRRRPEAAALYAAAPTADRNSPLLAQATARVAARARPPRLPNDREGASRALTLAATLAREQRAHQFAAVYSRLALELTPDDDYRLRYADALGRARLDAASRQVLAEVQPSKPPTYTVAQAQLADSLARAGRPEEALAAYRRAVAASPRSEAASLAYASQLVSLKRNREALDLLESPLLATGAQTAFTRFLRGAAYEGVGRAVEAEQELQAAVTLQPDNPMYLNFLGYLWVDSGTRVDEGAAMIARALSAQPDDGNVQDSLGWAQFRQTRYDEAVTTLEGAVAKEPANAEINDHLGDAYWRVGRRREAGWQWNRVLTLSPDAERRAEVEKKLAEGLPEPEARIVAVEPAPVPTPASTVGNPS